MMNPSVFRNSPAIRWIAFAGWLALLLALAIQWRSISLLRHENNALRVHSQARPLESERPAVASAAPESIDREQLQKDRLELLRLRNEVRQLRDSVSPVAAPALAAAAEAAGPSVSAEQSPEDEARRLAVVAMGGDTGALDKLANLVAGSQTMDAEERAAALSRVRSAFQMLGTEAGKGNLSALQALWQASRIGRLQGFAADGLGQAAALGNDEALKPLLDPEAYLLLRSSAVSALKPAADAGNERAIQALAATGTDPEQQALWLLAAQGLERAAAAGNPTAIDGLAAIATSTNQSVSKEAVLALEAAARNRHLRAEQALRNLHWR